MCVLIFINIINEMYFKISGFICCTLWCHQSSNLFDYLHTEVTDILLSGYNISHFAFYCDGDNSLLFEYITFVVFKGAVVLVKAKTNNAKQL